MMRNTKMISLAIAIVIILGVILISGCIREKGLSMVCQITDISFKIDGEEAGYLAILAGNYNDRPKYTPEFGEENDLDWFSENGVLTLNFHPRKEYRSPYGEWANNQYWAYIGFSNVYCDENGTLAGPANIKLFSDSLKALHLKFSVKATANDPELLKTIRAGGGISDFPVYYEHAVEIDNYPNRDVPLENASCEHFVGTYYILAWSDWSLVNDEWTEVDLNLTQIGFAALEKCPGFQNKTIDDLYLFEAMVGPEFKVGDELRIQVRDFEMYEE